MVAKTVFFLPGIGASPAFWQPVGALLPEAWGKVFFGWPGLSSQPADPTINGYEDLVRLVEDRIDGPVDLVAQSMGGMIAAQVALNRPGSVRRLVLNATSGGVDASAFGGADWRTDYSRRYPGSPAWVTDRRAAASLPVEKIECPTLLIWGDADPISPLAVGRHLQSRIRGAEFHVIASDDHRFAESQPRDVAPLIAAFLSE